MKILAFALGSRYSINLSQPPALLNYDAFPEYPFLQGQTQEKTFGLSIAKEAREVFFTTRVFELIYEELPSKLALPKEPAMVDASK